MLFLPEPTSANKKEAMTRRWRTYSGLRPTCDPARKVLTNRDNRAVQISLDIIVWEIESESDISGRNQS